MDLEFYKNRTAKIRTGAYSFVYYIQALRNDPSNSSFS